MKRRDFLTRAGIGALTGAGALALAGCGDKSEQPAVSSNGAPQQRIRWRMVTTWPKNFPGLGTGAENIAKWINAMAGGRLTVEVYGAGEIVPALEVFDAVQAGTISPAP